MTDDAIRSLLTGLGRTADEIADFIRAFDREEYPHLIAGAR